MPKLIAMRGWSGSGKSTEAAKIANKTGAVIVCRDSLRHMILAGRWWTGNKEDEDRVTIAEEAQVTALLRAGVSCILDATHLHHPFLRKWAKLATRLGVEFEVVDVHADLAECKRRAYERWRKPGPDFGRYIDSEVIEKQVRRWPVEKWPVVTATPFRPEPVEWIKGLSTAVIFDIDGTLAHIPDGGRSPYDYTRVSEDVVDDHVAWLANEVFDMRYTGEGPRVLIMSGRDDSCRDDTIKWLFENGIPFDELHMRPADAKDERGGKLPDFIVKHDLFNQHVRGRFNVRMVVDDRLQVCELWHRLGLKVFRVGDPNANF